MLGAGLDDAGELALLARLGAGGQEAGGADDGVQLVAQLVAEVSQDVGVDVDDASVPVGVVVPRRFAELPELVHQ